MMFASDNYAPTHPAVLEAIAQANTGHAGAYGSDQHTAAFDHRIGQLFGAGSRAWLVANGTGANVLSLMAVTPRWGSVVTSDAAHLNVDENAAPEKVAGLKLLTCPSGPDGKLTAQDVAAYAGQAGDQHRAQPSTFSLTQATELGTVYSLDHLRDLVSAAHAHNMTVHMDGSRIANAAAHCGVSLREMTADVGVDILSLGAAKNGGMMGEAVVVMAPDAAPTAASAQARARALEGMAFLRKSSMQLLSKMRYLSAQMLALYGQPGQGTDAGLWLDNAQQSNSMAQYLAQGIEALAHAGLAHAGLAHAGLGLASAVGAGTMRDDAGLGLRVSRPVQSNAVFITLPRELSQSLRQQTSFYEWGDGETADRVEARLMCSWDTSRQDVDSLLALIDKAAHQAGGTGGGA